MKYILISLTLFSLLSCENYEPKELKGSWKILDVEDQTGQNASEKTTFYDGDSLSIEMFLNKKFYEKQRAKYNFDTINKVIHIEAPKIGVIDFKVLKLTSTEMELLDSKQKKATRFIRAE